LATLEEPHDQDTVIVDIARSPDEIVGEILNKFGLGAKVN
jgi:hypothetical protein